tara:strand:- start:65 stop:2020 length:1956 start_codon:yes stop_codon:yes gene_type:complete
MLKNYPYRDQDAGNPGGGNAERLAQINLERDALEQNAQEMRKYGIIGKQTYNEINDLSKAFSKNAADEAFALEKSGEQLRSKQDLLAAAAKNERMNFDLRTKAAEFAGTDDEKRFKTLIKRNETEAKGIQDQIQGRNELNEKMGIFDDLLRIADKLPIIGDLGVAKEALTAMETTTLKTGSGLKGMGSATKVFGNALKQAGPAIIFAKALDAMLDFSKAITQAGRELGISRKEATEFGRQMQFAAFQSGDVLATSEKLLEVNSKLNAIRGTAANFTDQQLIESNRLLETEILTADAAGRFSQLASISGMSIRETTKAAIAGTVAAEREGGVRLNLKSILDATSKVTGQVSANLGGNPEKIAKAVALAKQFGMELQEVVSTSKSLLDFQSSIDAELQAELFTGKQINLERARLFSLTGDYEGLTREINKEVGDFYEFSKLNVLQQDALSKAFGMNSDQMSEMLLKQEDLATLKQRARDEDNEALLTNLEQLDVQQRLAVSMEKLSKIAADVLTVVMPMIEGFADLIVMIASNKILSGAILGGIGGFMLGGPYGALAGVIAGTTMGVMNDGVIGPGGETVVSGPEGSIKLNKRDSMIVGTDLGGNEGSGPNRMAQETIDILKDIAMASKTNKRIVYNSFDAVKADRHHTTKYS